MRTWPALEVRVGSDPELLHAALTDFDVSAIDDNAPDTWRVFFHTADERDRAARALIDYAAAAVDVPDEDWAARSQANLTAVTVGNLVIAPPWDAGRSTRTTVVIQPSMGFGTGHHATTRLCVAALQRVDVRGRSVLDVGTGSGVLAIAASLLGAAPVVALDDDPDAVQAARENVTLNPGASVDVRVQDLRSGALPPFDLVLANLTGGLLIQSAARLRELTAPGGHLILSGFMLHEENDVLITFPKWGRESFTEDEWGCALLQAPRPRD